MQLQSDILIRTSLELKAQEFALLAGLFQSPSAYNPIRFPEKAKKRQRQVIQALYDSQKISSKYAQRMLKAPLRYANYKPKNLEVAPHFIDYIKEQARKLLGKPLANKGLRIYTSLDSQLQKKAQQSLKEHAYLLEEASKNLVSAEARKAKDIEVALMAVDTKSREIVAMIGGKDYNPIPIQPSTMALEPLAPLSSLSFIR